jgi:alkanesulfonate monooxygenase SsuD/methylene tetrahydromethanopterin reductase-like flavin-dependent oxidoreductase (luciferase family)
MAEEAAMRRGFAVFAGVGPEIVRASAQGAETLGYSSFWVNYPGSIDGLAALVPAALETRSIALGVGVVPLHTRRPESIEQGVRTHTLPLDRLLLGVGSAGPGALRRVREGVAALRAALPVRIIAAALGPRMCRLAGEVADGVLFNWLTPDYARRSAEWVRAGADAAGRVPPMIMAYVRLAVGSLGMSRFMVEADRYASIPAYAAHFQRMGAPPGETAIVADTPDAVPAGLSTWEGAVDEIVLRAITGQETVEEYVALVRAASP